MFKCQLCDYITTDRCRIHKHHIVPRQSGGSNHQYNVVYLCPNHHSKVFSHHSKSGIHTHRKGGIIIIGWYQSTTGRTLRYIDQNGQQKFT